jgi:hypothetical protein
MAGSKESGLTNSFDKVIENVIKTPLVEVTFTVFIQPLDKYHPRFYTPTDKLRSFI